MEPSHKKNTWNILPLAVHLLFCASRADACKKVTGLMADKHIILAPLLSQSETGRIDLVSY